MGGTEENPRQDNGKLVGRAFNDAVSFTELMQYQMRLEGGFNYELQRSQKGLLPVMILGPQNARVQ
jgi:hypothetical protein